MSDHGSDAPRRPQDGPKEAGDRTHAPDGMHSGRRRRRRRGPRKRADELVLQDAEPVADEPFGVAADDGPQSRCPVCGLVIRNLYTAITDQESQSPAHFDCVLRKLADAEELAEGERLAYLGGGSFGVIQARARQRQRGHHGRNRAPAEGLIFVRKRIEYEPTEPLADWRRGLVLPGPGLVVVELGEQSDDQVDQ